ncbi:general transcription factor II-I repeat domain-containing protein 2 isoform X2 [Peromyscus leucopus]|uniref:general transcription factor II-I repeat domain-containing protein 2 isoform X2 n=1 Tax=Peromyscus leucopus TaxID=10041 RepID=UPI0010A16CAA|nr:general transcription factor II-I repeat domain-containing protein 2 isoform X2 [Peromyscus leucopus]
MAQVAVSTLPVGDESSDRTVVTFLMSALESMCKELAKSKAEVACIAVYETDVYVVGTDRGCAFVNARQDFQKDFAQHCQGEGLTEEKPQCPENGTQVCSGEAQLLRKAVEDHFCLCYRKALGTTAMVPVPYEQMLQDKAAVLVQGLPEGLAFQHPDNYSLATLRWILENKAGISFIINRPFLGAESQLGGLGMATGAQRLTLSPNDSCGPISVKTEPMEDSGTSPKAAAVLVKTESEDPNYHQWNMQGSQHSSTSSEVTDMELPSEESTPLVSSGTNEDPEADVKMEGNANPSNTASSAAGVEDLRIVQVTVPDNEKERLSGIEKIKQLREQVNYLFSKKFGEAIGVDFPVKVPYRKITFNPGCVVIDGMPPGVVFKAPGYLEISSMRRILDAADFIKFTVIRPLPGLELSNVGKRKIDQEGRVFQEKWERAYFFVEVQSMPTCLICKQSVSVSKEYNLRRHYQTNHSRHYDQYSGPARDEKLRDLKRGLQKYLVGSSDIVGPEQAFANASPPVSTVTQPVEDLTVNLRRKLRQKIQSFVAYSIAIDEITDINDTTQLAIFIRGVDDNFDVSEELLDTVPMTGAQSGNEIFLHVEKSLKKFSIEWSKLVSVASTGTPAMVDGHSGLVTKLRARVASCCKGADLKSVRCIIHPEWLCAQKLRMGHVMDVVVESVNSICSRGLNHGDFTTLLYELDTQYGSLLYHTALKWLGRGLVLRRFFESLEEIDLFMSSRGKPMPQLSSRDWILDLAFLVDMTMHLNTLDASLQGHSQIVTQMYDFIRAFLAKLCLWETHLARNNLAHFPTLKSVSRSESDGLNYIPKIVELKAEFQKRLSDFEAWENELTLFSSPFATKIDSVREELQMEVIDLQCNTVLRTKYDKVGVPDFYKHLWSSYPKYRSHCAKMLSMFSSTHICEQLFSIMKLSKKEAQWGSGLQAAT